jgi:hypothetical protein
MGLQFTSENTSHMLLIQEYNILKHCFDAIDICCSRIQLLATAGRNASSI